MSVLPSPLTFDAASHLYVVTLIRPIKGVILRPPLSHPQRRTLGQSLKAFLRTGVWRKFTSPIELKSMHDIQPEDDAEQTCGQIFHELSAHQQYIFETQSAAIRQMNTWLANAGKLPSTIAFETAALTEALPHFAERLPKNN